jgi:glycosyltransferase involved in cell wall biosynthesis
MIGNSEPRPGKKLKLTIEPGIKTVQCTMGCILNAGRSYNIEFMQQNFGNLKILIIIPAFNEAENIASVIAEVQSLNLNLQVLVIDDGSADATSTIAQDCGATVLRLPFNLGYGAAVQTGLQYGVENQYDICVLTDGDGQHDPKYIQALVSPVAEGQADIALGSRFLGTTEYKIPFSRRIGMSLFRKIASRFTHQQITDPTSGFQAIGRNLMGFFVNDNYPYDFPDADTLIRLYFAGFMIQEVPVTIRPRLKGESMHGGFSTIYYIYKMFFSIFIALTQKKMLTKGKDYAIGNKDTDSSRKLIHHSDDNRAGTQKAP